MSVCDVDLGPVVGGLTNKYGCRAVTVCGSVLAAVGVGVSSFSTHINMLIATYGLLAGHLHLHCTSDLQLTFTSLHNSLNELNDFGTSRHSYRH